VGFFQDYMEGMAMRKNPQLLQQKLSNIDADALRGTMEEMYGQEATPANYQQQTVETEGPMQPGQARDYMQINQLDPGEVQAQEEVEGSGLLGSSGSPEESRYLQAQKILGMSGQGAGMKQQSNLLSQMQNSIMSGSDDGFGYEEYAAANPEERAMYDRYKGRFDYSGGAQDPSQVAEHKYYLSLNDAGKKEYLQRKRADQIVDQGTYRTNTRTDERYDKNIIESKIQEGYGKSVSDKLEGYADYKNQSRDAESEVERILFDLDNLEAGANKWSTGWGSLLKDIPETEALDWEEQKKTVLSALSLEKMLELKAASPSGSTGFGALNAKELEVLQTNLASLKGAQSAPAIRRSIGRIRTQMKKVGRNVREDRARSALWYKKNSKYQDRNRGGRYEAPSAPKVGDDPAFEKWLQGTGG